MLIKTIGINLSIVTALFMYSIFPTSYAEAGSAQNCAKVYNHSYSSNHVVENLCNHHLVVFYCIKGRTCGRNKGHYTLLEMNPYFPNRVGVHINGASHIAAQGEIITWAVCDAATPHIKSDNRGNFSCYSKGQVGGSSNSNPSNNTNSSNSSNNNLDSTALVAQIVNVETEDWLGPDLESELSFEKLKKWRMARIGETRFDYCMRRGPFYFESERKEFCQNLLAKGTEKFDSKYPHFSSSDSVKRAINRNNQNCTAAETDGSVLNVRATPNGELINRLRNGREIAITQYQNDSKGRPWGYATGYYNGKFRNWGWVFMASVRCQ